MEIKFTEIDETNKVNEFNDNLQDNFYNEENFWEQKEVHKKKKKVTFNDILSNMNLVVNKEGVLQFMIPVNNVEKQDLSSKNSNVENQYNNIEKKNKPIHMNIKHSYIYNKYFKNYTDVNVEKPAPRVPKTIEEYKIMLLEDRVKAIEYKKMIEQVKSKKMMFTSNPDISFNPRNIQSTKNNLRFMNFG
jgi:hypothetical protein